MMCKYAQFMFAAIPLGGLLMNWDDLRFFLALAREGTVSGAGRVLSVKHTTVARRIAALEEQLGSRLFDRLRGGYAMTQAAGVPDWPRGTAIATWNLCQQRLPEKKAQRRRALDSMGGRPRNARVG